MNSNILKQRSYKSKLCFVCNNSFFPSNPRNISCSAVCKSQIKPNGKKKSVETRRKMSIARLGMKIPEDVRKKISLKLTGTKTTWSRTDDYKRRLSKSLIGKNLGKKRSEEVRRKLSERQKGKKFSAETRKKMSEYAKLRTYSDSTRKKLSDSILNRENSYQKRYEYNGRFYRSTYETSVAKYLTENNIPFEYESSICRHSENGINVYVVDFYLPQLKKWIEVKGYWSIASIQKCNSFVRKFGKESLLIIDFKNIKNISLNRFFSETEYFEADNV